MQKKMNKMFYSSNGEGEGEGPARTHICHQRRQHEHRANEHKKINRILTTVFIVIYFDSILFLRVLTSRSHSGRRHVPSERAKERERETIRGRKKSVCNCNLFNFLISSPPLLLRPVNLEFCCFRPEQIFFSPLSPFHFSSSSVSFRL